MLFLFHQKFDLISAKVVKMIPQILIIPELKFCFQFFPNFNPEKLK